MVHRCVLRLWLTSEILTVTSGAAFALPAIPSSLVQQAKNLSPAEQSALAAQYGIALPTQQVASQPQAASAIEAPIVQNVLREDRAADASEPASDKMLPRFGAKLFSSDFAVYTPSDKWLAPTGCLLVPGDVLNVQVFGNAVSVDHGS